jgi:hypothetical protein
MTTKTHTRKRILFREAIQSTIAFLGILSSILTILIFIGISDIKTLLLSQTEKIDISLDEKYVNKIPGKSITIKGTVLLNRSKISAFQYLKKNNLDIYPLARRTVPLGNWRVFPKPIIKDNGDLFFTIDLSYLSSKDSSNTIQIILISCGSNFLSDGFEFNNILPYLDVSSNPIITNCY